MWQKSKKPVYWILLLVVMGISSVIGREIGGSIGRSSNQETLSNVVSQAATRLNAQAPKKLDEVTTLVRAEAVDGKKLVAFYTLADFDSYATGFSFSHLKSLISKQLCEKQKSNKPSALSMGMTHEYVYTRENGSEISRFEISSKDCLAVR